MLQAPSTDSDAWIEIVAACASPRKKVLKVSDMLRLFTDGMQMFTSTYVPHLTQREQSQRQLPTASAPTTDSTNNAALFSDDEGATVQPAAQRGVGGGDVRGTNESLTPAEWRFNVACASVMMSPYISHTFLVLLFFGLLSISARARKEPLLQFLFECSANFVFFYGCVLVGAMLGKEYDTSMDMAYGSTLVLQEMLYIFYDH